MDKLSGLASKLGGGSSSSGSNTNQAAGNEDYLDKGLDSVEKKYGGGKVDPAKMRSTNEKITDTVREKFEGATGKNVPDKFSN
ncbi:uncharacterized protein N7503_006720 [Penicillium pulvis]|uniref:Uncharacterized protein n=1 Tax=Penicillium frequentans TaxID=3151616 RepID=A0AAD6CU54_9EURO|nr:uncharacterized protein N7503_006720 [Penicillium pulvis]KAJ5538775.1 hypothetical protein N7494_008254 [Penicillium glabrum]KAJ5549486.1 hypothetical protein N7513_006720 [Penicillium glabrum]KAJ5797424.1 hypothetical protein N7503_006720 [Penicillium pulvis]